MKHKSTRNPAELQKHVDYIIRLADIIDYSENGSRMQEESHIDVDVVLAEPLTALRKPKTHAHKVSHAEKTENIIRENRDHKDHLIVPRRERLIVHAEYAGREYFGGYEEKRNLNISQILYTILKSFKYSSKH